MKVKLIEVRNIFQSYPVRYEPKGSTQSTNHRMSYQLQNIQFSSVPGNVFIGCFHWVFPGKIAKQRHSCIFHSLSFGLHPNIIIPYSRTSRGNSRLFSPDTKLMALASTHLTTKAGLKYTCTRASFVPVSPTSIGQGEGEGSPYRSKVLLCCHSSPWCPCISFQPRW